VMDSLIHTLVTQTKVDFMELEDLDIQLTNFLHL